MASQDGSTFAKEFAEKGLDAIPEMLRVLINQVMQTGFFVPSP
jgi:hypothetical protein